ncbi:MAG TPA: RimK family alpha-L-glutamate ligase [Limnochordales bacterium]
MAIVTHDRHARAYRTRALLDRLRRRGAAWTVLSPDQIVMYLSGSGVRLFDPVGRPLHPDVVLNALYLASGHGLEIIEGLEALGIPVVNSAAGWRKAKTKALASVAFHVHGVTQPETVWSAGAPPSVYHVARAGVGPPLVYKPWRGTLGVGVTLLTRPAAVGRVVTRLARRGAPVYLQRFVPNPGRDIRVMVVGDQAIGATYRLARRGRWKTNVAAGGIPAPCPVTDELAAVAIAATRSVGLDIAGVDVIEGPHGYAVLEINAWPNYRRFDQVAGVDVADCVAALLISRGQSGTPSGQAGTDPQATAAAS